MTISGHREPTPPMVSPFTFGWSPCAVSSAMNVNASSGAFESAGRAIYYPLLVPIVCVARRVWWANGATTTGGATIEAGIYRDVGTWKPVAKLISGSAVQGTASQVQFVDITDTTLSPGLWWLAIMASSVTNTTLMRAVLLAPNIDALYRMEEASANPLPATATPVETTSASGQVWLFGFSTTTIT